MACNDLIQLLVDNYDPDKISGIDAIIQFDLTGDAPCLFWLRITETTCEPGTGQSEEAPAMTLKANLNDFIAVLNGDIPPMQAFMHGKIKIKGDTFLAMKLQTLLV